MFSFQQREEQICDGHGDKAALIKVHRPALSAPVDSSSDGNEQNGAIEVNLRPANYVVVVFNHTPPQITLDADDTSATFNLIPEKKTRVAG